MYKRQIWCFTGFRLDDELLTDGSYPRCEATDKMLACIDVLVDGRFEQDTASMELDWRGSANQRLINVPESLEKGCVVLYEKRETE